MTITMSFSNLTDFDFHSVFSYREDPGLVGHNKVPSKIMKPKIGVETLQVTQEWLDWMADGDSDYTVEWFPSTAGETDTNYANGFGIKIHSPIQVFGIGARPRWSAGYYYDGHLTPSLHVSGFMWDEMKGDKIAQTYKFPFLKGYSVEVTPTSKKSDLTLSIRIRNT